MSRHKNKLSVDANNTDYSNFSSPKTSSTARANNGTRLSGSYADTTPIESSLNQAHYRRMTSPAASGNDDLFLNLANDSTPSLASEELLDRSEKLRSRISSFGSKKAPSAYKDSLYRRRGISEDHSPKVESSPITATDDINGQRYHRDPAVSVMAAPQERPTLETQSQINTPVDPRLRPLNLATRLSAAANNIGNKNTSSSTTNSISERLSSPIRESSNDPTHPRRPPYRPSNLSYNSPGSFEYALAARNNTSQSRTTSRSRPQSQAEDASESVDSTTAASTVWDELDELKSRIRKLEITGGGSRSRYGAGQMVEAGDRPYTATTRTTTSTSPKEPYHQLSSPTKSAAGGTSLADSYPLLWSALHKTRYVVDTSVYKALESSATDALELAAFAMRHESQDDQYTMSNGDDVHSDKRIRRKADNMCRSLTELCIALCEDKSRDDSSPTFSQPQQAQAQSHYSSRPIRDKPTSFSAEPQSAVSAPAETNYSPSTYLEQRRAREQHRRPSSRIIANGTNSRPTSRQSSVVSRSRSTYTGTNPDYEHETSEAPTTPRAALHRSSTTPSRTRYAESMASGISGRSGFVSNASANEDRDDTLRAIASSNTNYPPESYHARKRGHQQDLKQFSRDYTERHPLPDISFRDNQSTYSVGSSAVGQQPPSVLSQPSRRIPVATGGLSTQAQMQTSNSASRDLRDRLAERRRTHGVASAGVLSGREQEQRLTVPSQQRVEHDVMSENASVQSGGYYASSSAASARPGRHRGRRTTDGMIGLGEGEN